MTTLAATVKAIPEGDSTILAILTGGIYDAAELDRDGLTIRDMETARDATGRLKPCAVIRWRGSAPYGGMGTFIAERGACEIYYYQDQGYSQIEAAKARMKTLLHRKWIASADYESLAWLNWVFDRGEFIAEELGNCPADMSRFEVITTRK